MHPIITVWLAYEARLRTQPRWTDESAWASWLDDCCELSDWFNTLRRLKYA